MAVSAHDKQICRHVDRVLAQSEEGDFLGFKIRVLSVAGLIAAKKAAARTKDQSHLLELEELQKLEQDEET